MTQGIGSRWFDPDGCAVLVSERLFPVVRQCKSTEWAESSALHKLAVGRFVEKSSRLASRSSGGGKKRRAA